ncbi:MAG TPA: FAD-dependent oxidoreductase [Anaerolineales bacterium]|nr:FAD-dependent oxidoreductase [Anaerolineales bacterium]
MIKRHVVVIGAGSTGAAIAHDLALRGLQVTLVERLGPASGTTGHNQAQLHSGARYAVNDPHSARECAEENLVLRRIMPHALELNDGLFIALREEHLNYREPFLEGCAQCNIPTREMSPAEALQIEPGLNPGLLAAIRIPDGVFDPYRFTLSFIATARKNGATFLPFTEVVGIEQASGKVRVHQKANNKIVEINCDAIINAAGPWAPRIAEMAGVALAVEASAGVMVTLSRRLCNMVINLLAPPADGDIIVPQRNTSILGTTSWTVEDPDNIPIPPDHVDQLLILAEWMMPGASQVPVRGVMAAARPLIHDESTSGRASTRGDRSYDHADQGAPGFFSIIGGKTTTARLMAEKISNLVCSNLGIDRPCRTRIEPLVSYRFGM